MENMVTMALSDYDALKEQIERLKQKLAEKQKELDDINIFEFDTMYSENLKAVLTDDAQHYLNKAFAKYESEYTAKRSLKDFTIWDYATPKPVEVTECEIDEAEEKV